MTRLDAVGAWFTPEPVRRGSRFPGPLLGGAALIAGPALWCLGLLLRYLPKHIGLLPADRMAELEAQPFAAPTQLALYAANPALVTTAYAVFLLGAVVLFVTYAALGRVAAVASPRLVAWGATLLVVSLFARFFKAGAETAAFAMVDTHGTEAATAFVMESYQTLSYGPWRIAVWCAVGQYLGMVLLALAAYRSRVLGAARCAALIWGGSLWSGVLKESHLLDVLAWAAVCAALIPLGVRVLRDRDYRFGARPAGHPVNGFRWWLPQLGWPSTAYDRRRE